MILPRFLEDGRKAGADHAAPNPTSTIWFRCESSSGSPPATVGHTLERSGHRQVTYMSRDHITPYSTAIGTADALDVYGQALDTIETGPRTAPEAASEEVRRRLATPDHEFVDHLPGDFERMLERVLPGGSSIRNIE